MKLQQTYLKQQSFRFKRWSRKGYAAFFSLRRTVNIGQLSSNVAERFQIKNGSNHSSVVLAEQVASLKEKGTDIIQEEQHAETMSWFMLVLLFLFSVQTTKQTVAAAWSAYTYNLLSEAGSFSTC